MAISITEIILGSILAAGAAASLVHKARLGLKIPYFVFSFLLASGILIDGVTALLILSGQKYSLALRITDHTKYICLAISLSASIIFASRFFKSRALRVMGGVPAALPLLYIVPIALLGNINDSAYIIGAELVKGRTVHYTAALLIIAAMLGFSIVLCAMLLVREKNWRVTGIAFVLCAVILIFLAVQLLLEFISLSSFYNIAGFLLFLANLALVSHRFFLAKPSDSID